MPERLHYRRGQPLPPGARLVTRASRFGNPYRVGDPGVPTRERAARLFAEGIVLRRHGMCPPRMGTYPSDDEIKAELRGADLACACPPDDGPCHANTLLWVANS